MTNTQMLAKLNEYVGMLDKETQNEIIRIRDFDRSECCISNAKYGCAWTLGDLIYQLECDIKEEECAKKHGTSFKKQMDKLSKLVSSNTKEQMQHIWREHIDNYDYACACIFGSYAFFLKCDIPFHTYEHLDHVFLAPIYTEIYKNIVPENILLDVNNLKAQYKIYKTIPSNTRPKFKYIKIGTQYFNLEYLINICDVLGGEIKINNSKSVLGGAFLFGDNGEAILMPIHPRAAEGENQ